MRSKSKSREHIITWKLINYINFDFFSNGSKISLVRLFGSRISYRYNIALWFLHGDNIFISRLFSNFLKIAISAILSAVYRLKILYIYTLWVREKKK